MSFVVEAECLAAVPMDSGHEFSLIKIGDETIQSTLHPSRGRLERGERYEVTFRKLPRPEGLTP